MVNPTGGTSSKCLEASFVATSSSPIERTQEFSAISNHRNKSLFPSIVDSISQVLKATSSRSLFASLFLPLQKQLSSSQYSLSKGSFNKQHEDKNSTSSMLLSEVRPRLHSIVWMLECLVFNAPFLSLERKQRFHRKLQECQAKERPFLWELFLAVIFLSAIAATLTCSRGVGYDFILLFLIAGLWMITTWYSRQKIVVSPAGPLQSGVGANSDTFNGIVSSLSTSVLSAEAHPSTSGVKELCTCFCEKNFLLVSKDASHVTDFELSKFQHCRSTTTFCQSNDPLLYRRLTPLVCDSHPYLPSTLYQPHPASVKPTSDRPLVDPLLLFFSSSSEDATTASSDPFYQHHQDRYIDESHFYSERSINSDDSVLRFLMSDRVGRCDSLQPSMSCIADQKEKEIRVLQYANDLGSHAFISSENSCYNVEHAATTTTPSYVQDAMLDGPPGLHLRRPSILDCIDPQADGGQEKRCSELGLVPPISTPATPNVKDHWSDDADRKRARFRVPTSRTAAEFQDDHEEGNREDSSALLESFAVSLLAGDTSTQGCCNRLTRLSLGVSSSLPNTGAPAEFQPNKFTSHVNTSQVNTSQVNTSQVNTSQVNTSQVNTVRWSLDSVSDVGAETRGVVVDVEKKINDWDDRSNHRMRGDELTSVSLSSILPAHLVSGAQPKAKISQAHRTASTTTKETLRNDPQASLLMTAKRLRQMLKDKLLMLPRFHSSADVASSRQHLLSENKVGGNLSPPLINVSSLAELRELVETSNELWDWIHQLYSACVSDELVYPEQTWVVNLASTGLHRRKDGRIFFEMDMLNELMSATYELLDAGRLELLDSMSTTPVASTPLNKQREEFRSFEFQRRYKSGAFLSLPGATTSTDAFDASPGDFLDGDMIHSTRTRRSSSGRSSRSNCTRSGRSGSTAAEEPSPAATTHFDWTLATRALHQLSIFFFSTAECQGQRYNQPSVQQFLELAIRCHLLIRSDLAVVITHGILSKRLSTLPLSSVLRCLHTSLVTEHPALAIQYWDTIEALYGLPLTETQQHDVENLQALRDVLCPVMIYCRCQHKMFSRAIELLDGCLKYGGSFPRLSPSLGIECGRVDLLLKLLDRGCALEDVVQYIQVAEAVGAGGDLPEVLKAVKQLEADRRLKGNIPANNSALCSCIRNGDLSTAETLFEFMLSSHTADVCSFNLMMQGCGQAKPDALDFVCGLLETMKKFSVKPNGESYHCLIGAAISANQLGLAWRWFDEMEQSNIEVGTEPLRMMIEQLRPTASPMNRRRTLELIDKMDVVQSGSVLVCAAIDALARLTDRHRLQLIGDKFRRSGVSIHSDLYGALIGAYGRCRDVDSACKLWEEVVDTRKLKPSNYACASMVETLVSNGRLAEGIDLVKKLLSGGTGSSATLYGILLKVCAHQRKRKTAIELYDDMRQRLVPITVYSYNTLINVCSTAGDIMSAEKIMEDMKQSNHCQPDVISYSILIKGFCSLGQIDRGFELFCEMESRGILPDAIVFNTLLEGCSKKNQVDSAEKVFERMLEREIAPSNVTLTILIKLYGKTNHLDRALRLAEEMPQRYGFEPDVFVYTALVAACIINGNIDQGLKHFDEMRSGKMSSSVTGRAFGTVITGCMKANLCFTAYELLQDAHARRLDVDLLVAQRLHQMFLNSRDDFCSVVPNTTNIYVADILSWLAIKASMHSHSHPQPHHKGYMCQPPLIPAFILRIFHDIERRHFHGGVYHNNSNPGSRRRQCETARNGRCTGRIL